MPFLRLCAPLCLCVCCWQLQAAALSPEEQKQQNDFKAKYKNPDKGQRKAALAILDGARDPSSRQLLASVASTDPEKEVRAEAFDHLSRMPAHDPTLARLLAAAFANSKGADSSNAQELAFARSLPNSEFKYDVLAALVNFGSQLHYIETDNRNGMRRGLNTTNLSKVNDERAAFQTFLMLFNTLAQSDIQLTARAPGEVKTWWANNQSRIAAEDMKLAEKYRVADAELAGKK